MGQSIRLGRVGGIEIGLNWSVLVIFWLVTWSLASGRFPQQFPGYGSTTYWVAGIAAGVIFFASLLAHELGHALLARRYGVQVDGIILWLFGGVAQLRGEAMTPGAELRIAAVGPAASLVLAVLFSSIGAILSALDAPALVGGMAGWLGIINLSLAIFNLVPAFPLDGGRVLRAILWSRSEDRPRATRTAARAGRAFAYGLIILGIVEFAFAAGLGGLWFVFLGWFLLNAAQAEESQTLLTAALRGIRVDDIMSIDPITAPDSLDVQSFIDDYAMRHRFTTFPVRESSGRIVGLVTLRRVKPVPTDARPTTAIRSVACPIEEVATALPQEPAVEVLGRMKDCSDGRALVFEDGQLVGIVSPRDIEKALDLTGLMSKAPRLELQP